MVYYSHSKPRKIILQKHLRYVGNRSKKIINSKVFNGIDKDILSDVSHLIGSSHDFGKYTPAFQEKLKLLKDEKDPSTYHGLLSALFTFDVLTEYIKMKKLTNTKPYKFLPLIGYFVVKRHHLNLDDIEDDIRVSKMYGQFKYISKQIQDIKEDEQQIKKEYVGLFKDYNISIDKIFKGLDKYKTEIKHSKDIKPIIKEIRKQYSSFTKESNIIYYLLTLLLFSVLIDSDKKHAGGVDEIERKTLPENLVKKYKMSSEFKKKNKSNINKIKDEINKSVMKNIRHPKNANQKLYTLTAPTGTGKTLTSFEVALALRKIMKKEFGYEPRIIYSLPFRSIIHQTHEQFYDVLKQIQDFKENESTYLLEHHHLSDISYKVDNEEKDINEGLSLIESWDSEVVVTTFVQLFNALVGYKNRSLKKFHNIVNSIIILDEVQNIPIIYQLLTEIILTNMTKYFNCRVILMTATKPLIFKDGTYTELVDDYESYFKSDELNRVTLNIQHKKITIPAFCNSLNGWSKNSYLFILNTINSSLDFYKEILAKEQDFKIYYLSTNILPIEITRKIKEIKEALRNKQKIIIISTQIIEAGVDINCDVVYRDRAILSSIIQAIGRGNRSKQFGMADVYLLNLVDKNGRPYTGIYDSKLMDITDKIFEGKKKISEKNFLELINDYFQRVKTEPKSNTEKNIITAIHRLYFYDKNFDTDERTPISEFKLIEDQPYKVDVFIELDEKAKVVWEKYQSIIHNHNLGPIKRKEQLLKIRNTFYGYVISVNYKKLGITREQAEKTEIINLPKERYNIETGFIGIDDDNSAEIL